MPSYCPPLRRPAISTPKNKKTPLKPPFQTALNAPKKCLKKRTPPLLRALYRGGDPCECNARFSFKKRAVGRAPALRFTPFGGKPEAPKPEKRRKLRNMSSWKSGKCCGYIIDISTITNQQASYDVISASRTHHICNMRCFCLCKRYLGEMLRRCGEEELELEMHLLRKGVIT